MICCRKAGYGFRLANEVRASRTISSMSLPIAPLDGVVVIGANDVLFDDAGGRRVLS